MKYRYFKSIDKEYSDLFRVRIYDKSFMKREDIFIWFTGRYFPSSFLSLDSLFQERDVVEISESKMNNLLMLKELSK
jgi:hypothetical protein